MANKERMIGSLATNLHTAHRSEYLAHYVFSSFGAAVPVPQAEDCGLDLYCTLTEKDGKRSWARAMFAVQVKSDLSPWKFNSPDSVQWLVRSSVPVLLCAVDKKELRLRVYHTFPRFQLWTLEKEHSKRIELAPGPAEQPEETCGIGERQALGNPILDFTIAQLNDDSFHREVHTVLEKWLEIDNTNIGRLMSGLRRFSYPASYQANQWNPSGFCTVSLSSYAPDSLESLRGGSEPVLEELAQQLLRAGDEVGPVAAALLLRAVNPQWCPGMLTSLMQKLNDSIGDSSYLFAGLDEIKRRLKAMLNTADGA